MVSLRKQSRYERLSHRYGRTLTAFLVLLLLVFFGGFWRYSRPPSAWPRLSVLIMGDPVLVWSWDSRQNRSVVIILPAATQIEAVSGYGRYSLESLWKLGQIEKKPGVLLAGSLSEALGVPLTWHLEEPGSGGDLREGRPALKRIFGFSLIGAYLTGRLSTNLPWTVLLRLVRSAVTMAPQFTTVFDLAKRDLLSQEKLPDGTLVLQFDPEKWDFVSGSLFEDENVRAERLSVAIYNTTAAANLGRRAARFLGHLGVTVVTVGNETSSLNRCQISGQPAFLQSVTARLIRELWHCDLRSGEVGRADLTVRLGTEFEAQFLPAKD